MSVKIRHKDLGPLVKKAKVLLAATDADLALLKSIGSNGIPLAELKLFRKDLAKAFEDIQEAIDQDDEKTARMFLKAVTEISEESAIDDTANPVVTALVTLGFKSKIAKIIKEESLGEYIVGLGEDLDNVEVVESVDEEE